MTAIANLGSLINLATGGGGQAAQTVNFVKHPFVAGAAPGTLVAGRITDLWQWDGMPGGGGNSAPTSSTATSSSTAGSWKQTTPSAGTDLFLLSMNASAHVAGTLVLYDRLNQSGGLSATTTGAQTTNLPTAALTRYTNGVGVEIWIEIYTAIGSTGTTISASYTNQGGSSGQTTANGANGPNFGNTGFSEAQRILPLPLASGDDGARAVASVTIAASTLTAGNFGVTLAYPLINIPIPAAGAGALWSGLMISGGPLDLGTIADTCFAMAWVGNTATAPHLRGSAYFVSN